jgi:hypothetical protein
MSSNRKLNCIQVSRAGVHLPQVLACFAYQSEAPFQIESRMYPEMRQLWGMQKEVMIERFDASVYQIEFTIGKLQRNNSTLELRENILIEQRSNNERTYWFFPSNEEAAQNYALFINATQLGQTTTTKRRYW